MQVRLCGNQKKFVRGSSNLHELHPVNCKASCDQLPDRIQRNVFRQDTLLPEPAIPEDNGLDIVLVKAVCTANVIGRDPFFIFLYNGSLIFQSDLRVWNQGKKKECVGLTTLAATNPKDAKFHLAFIGDHGSLIVPVDTQASTALAGALQLMQIQGINDGIIEFLRKVVEIWDV